MVEYRLNKVTRQDDSRRLKQRYSMSKKNHWKIPKIDTLQVKTDSLSYIILDLVLALGVGTD